MVFLGPGDLVHVLQSPYIILNMGMLRVYRNLLDQLC